MKQPNLIEIRVDHTGKSAVYTSALFSLAWDVFIDLHLRQD